MLDDSRGAGIKPTAAPGLADGLISAAPAQARRVLDADAMLEKSILAVAHPDDEVLWFSSVLNRVNKILVCFMDAHPPNHTANPGRQRVLRDYPLDNIATLGIPEPGLFGAADWNNPVVAEFGLKVRRNASERSERSFHELKKILRPQLTPYRNVFTHNPWGEYGHEEHVQLYHVVTALKAELGFNLWFSNYCSDRSFTFMLRYTDIYTRNYVTLPTNQNLTSRIMRLYQEHSCWTWYDDWQAFREESFLEASSLASGVHPPGRRQPFPLNLMRRPRGRGHLFPLNLMRIDF